MNMPEPIQERQPLLTKTKTKITTKALVVASVALVGAGLFAAGGLRLRESPRSGAPASVCDRGSNAGRVCRVHRDCQTDAASRSARCLPAQPDLVVTSISPNPVTGFTLVRIDNRGGVASTGFEVGLSALASPTSTESIVSGSARVTDPISTGGNVQINVMLYYPEGSTIPSYPPTMGALKAIADTSREVIESNELNNTLTIAVGSTSTTALPDLVVSSISPNPITEITTVRITNRGTGTATAFNAGLIALASPTSTESIVRGSTRIASLAAGASVAIDVMLYSDGSTLPSYPSSMGALKAIADANREVVESNATNNELILAISPPR